MAVIFLLDQEKKVAHEGNSEFQEKILAEITPALQQLDNMNNLSQKNDSPFSENDTIDNSSQTNNLSSKTNKILNIPSFFAVNLIFKLYNVNLNKINSKDSYLYGDNLARFLLENRQKLHNNKLLLENPQSLDEYQNAIPVELYNLFSGMVSKLLLNRCQVANKIAKSRKKEIH
ncbi:unnamed protein product [Rhizophagus irregularis]|nr:unnamed protein product [Rhizophagus irregularis]